ncbi:integrase [Nocardiopsis mwathae]|uniref:Integrase n=1 Tax=Nocardiopsis mwathae TaxID=1472723 RepID=A0A7X0D762_9ACTN|nr:site-specific integrase [Nocardiopsis mwathae]MBB6174108.1 integrase [Nocardiopsis mwathae]
MAPLVGPSGRAGRQACSGHSVGKLTDRAAGKEVTVSVTPTRQHSGYRFAHVGGRGPVRSRSLEPDGHRGDLVGDPQERPGGGILEFKNSNGAVRYGIKFLRPLADASKKQVLRRRDENDQRWKTGRAAQAALRDVLGKIERDEYVDPAKVTFGAYLDEWAKGLRLAPSTTSSYEKNIRLHIEPNLGAVPLSKITGTKLSAFYRKLETDGRRDHRAGQGLSARSVRYIHTIIPKALDAAVNDDMISRNPADRANPPTAKQAKAPEIHPWSPERLRTFLDWSRENSDLHAAWFTLATTGVRRGEPLALRWRDVDLDARTMAVRPSATLVKFKGGGEQITEGPTKTNKARVVDLDDDTVALLQAHRRERANLALQLGRDDALVFADQEGEHLHPERFSRTFRSTVTWCRKRLGKLGHVDLPPMIRLHDLRHTHATVLLRIGTNPKIVSERLGHASVTITLDTYSHVLPTIQRAAVDQFHAAMSADHKYQTSISGAVSGDPGVGVEALTSGVAPNMQNARAATVSPLKITAAALAWERSPTPPPWSRDL